MEYQYLQQSSEWEGISEGENNFCFLFSICGKNLQLRTRKKMLEIQMIFQANLHNLQFSTTPHAAQSSHLGFNRYDHTATAIDMSLKIQNSQFILN